MKRYFPFVILVLVCTAFFYKSVIFGRIPFPGDLIISGYTPWRHQAYDGYVAGAVPSKDQYFDVARELYPWRTLVTHELKNGSAPLWNPYNFSGAPLLANFQSQVLYPFSLIYLFIPQIPAWTIMTILQPILGTVFLYLFAAEIGLSATAAICAALLFNFSSFANVWMEFTTVWHTILWLPLLLYIFEKSIKRRLMSPLLQAGYVIAVYCSITGGHPQDFINSFLFFVIYATARMMSIGNWTGAEKIRFLFIPVIPLTVISFLLSSAQLLPTIELFTKSSRVAHDFLFIMNTALVQLWQLPLLVTGEFFGNPATQSNSTGDFVGKTISIGAVGFIFAVHSLWTRSSSWHRKFFITASAVILLLSVHTPVSELLYRFPVPVLSTGTPTRVLFLLMLSLSMLAGFGVDSVIRNTSIHKKTLGCMVLILTVLWIFALAHPVFPSMTQTMTTIAATRKAMILTTLLTVLTFTIIGISKRNSACIYLLIPLCVVELFYSFIKFNPFVPPSFIYPQNELITYLRQNAGINRIWGYGTAGIESNLTTQVSLYSADGTDPLNLQSYNRFLQSSKDGHIARTFSRTTRSDAKIAPGYGESDLPQNTFRLRVMDMLGVRYIIDRAENPKNDNTFPIDRFRIAWQRDAWTVYENLKAAPRYFLTSDVRRYSGAEDFENQFFSGLFDPSKTVLIRSGDFRLAENIRTASKSSVVMETYSPTSIRIRTKSDTSQMLFLSDTYDDGWIATVNGAQSNIVLANYAFRGVIVPAGESIIEMSYRPVSFLYGIRVSIGVFVCLVIYFAVLSIRYKRKA